MQTAELTIIEALKLFADLYKEKKGRDSRMMFANYLTYSTDTGRCDECAEEANEIIAVFGLQLVAVPTTFALKDSFIVKRKEDDHRTA